MPPPGKSSNGGGIYLLVRPDPQVIWNTPKDDPLWRKYDARYARSNTGGGKWQNLRLPAQWQVRYKELTFQVKPMNFKHTGVFPEQAANWDFMMEEIRNAGRPVRVLNLFAYTGGATIACAAAGASGLSCRCGQGHGRSGQRKTQRLSGLEDRPIRWIVDDCAKFVEREIRRGKTYDAIIMDPPVYGRGPSGEVWKLEENLYPFVELVSQRAFRRSAVFYHQFLYDGSGPVRHALSDGDDRLDRNTAAIPVADELGLPVRDTGLAAAVRCDVPLDRRRSHDHSDSGKRPALYV